MPAILVLILVVVGLVLLIKLIMAISVFVAAHLALSILGVVLAAIATTAFCRLFIVVLERSVVMNWKSNFTRPPPKTLPDPIGGDAAPRRLFTLPSEQDHLMTLPSSAVLACEGPRCTSFLAEDPDQRWRCGTATTPQTDDADWDEVEDVREFCSHECMTRWMRENAAQN